MMWYGKDEMFYFIIISYSIAKANTKQGKAQLLAGCQIARPTLLALRCGEQDEKISSAILSHILSSRVAESCKKYSLRTDNRYGSEKEGKVFVVGDSDEPVFRS